MRTLILFILFNIQLITAQTKNQSFGAENEGSGAIMAVATNEYAIQGNSSGLTFADTNKLISVTTSQSFRSNSLAKYNVTGMLPFKTQTVGISIDRFGNDVYNETQGTLGFSHKLKSIALGASLNYHQYYTEGYNCIKRVSMNLGGIVKLNQKLLWGTYVTNINQAKLSKSSTDFIPTVFSTGLKYALHQNVNLLASIEKSVNYKTLIKVGILYQIIKPLCLNLGINTQTERISVGTSFNSKKISASCAYSYNNYLSSVFTLTFKLKLLK